MRHTIEVADIFRAAGPAYRAAHAGHLSLDQLKVMSAIETCRTAALGSHVGACTDCGHQRIAYNSCRNRHCPRCQGAAARTWLEAQAANLLPVGYFHVVFTLPAQIADIAFHNKALVYDLLFTAASGTMLTIAADPKHLGARIGITAVLHTWGSAMTHHPHIHMIVPGGGLTPDGRWISSRPAFLLPVRVLGALFRRLFMTRLLELHNAGKLAFFGTMAGLSDHRAFLCHLAPVRRKRWVVYAKAPFAGPEAVLAYLSRYTHRVAISNSRLIAFDETAVTFRYKDYRRPGADRQQVMTLAADEFIRRFLIHVLPRGFHRIRHYGLLGPQGLPRQGPRHAGGGASAGRTTRRDFRPARPGAGHHQIWRPGRRPARCRPAAYRCGQRHRVVPIAREMTMTRIVSVPTIMSGDWTVEGTRVLAVTIAAYLYAGHAEEEILADFPTLPRGSVAAVRLWMAGAGIDRTRELRRNSAHCLKCGTEIESTHRHDFRSCRCGNLAVDGGVGRSGYWRRVGGGQGDPGATWVDTSIFAGDQERAPRMTLECIGAAHAVS